MEVKKGLTLLKWVLVAFLIFFFCFESYQVSIEHHLSNTRLWRLITLLMLMVIILFKNKYTWILGIVLFVYSMYNITLVNVKYSEHAAQDFTSNFHDVFRNYLNHRANILLQAISIYFYLIALLVFSTYPVRKWYKISPQKVPQKKSYL